MSAVGIVGLLASMGLAVWGLAFFLTKVVGGSPTHAQFGLPVPSPPEEASWRLAAAELGLHYSPAWNGRGRLFGVVNGLQVEVDVVTRGLTGRAGDHTLIVLRSVDPRGALTDLGISRSLVIQRRTGAEVSLPMGGEEIRTGDLEFDRQVLVAGPRGPALAMMGDRGRRAARTLVWRGASIARGEVRLEEAGLIDGPHHLAATLQVLAGAAAEITMVAASEVPSTLAVHAITDSDPGAALRTLDELLAVEPQGAAAMGALKGALGSPHAEVRFFAATRVPPELGLPVLERLLDPEQASLPLRVLVLEHLARAPTVPGTRVGPGIRRSLADADLRVQRVAIRLLVEARDPTMEDALVEFGCPHDPELALGVARALTALAGRRPPAALLKFLEHSDSEVRTAAAIGLGRTGAVEAVEPLLKLTHGLLASGAVKDAAKEAIHLIQSRLGDVAGGRLALAEATSVEGALSMASAGGELAVVSEVASSVPSNRSRTDSEKGS